MLTHRGPSPAFHSGTGEARGEAAGRPSRRRADYAAARIAAACVVVALAGCASFSPDAGMDVVSGMAAAALQKEAVKIDSEEAAAAASARVRGLLAHTLSADAAV